MCRNVQYGKTFSCERSLFKNNWIIKPIFLKMLICQNKLNVKMLLWIQDTQTSLLGLKKKKSQFQYYASIFSFAKNTKQQLYEGIMQNLNENYLIIKFNTTRTHKHTICSRQKYMLKIPCSIKKFHAKSESMQIQGARILKIQRFNL